VFSIFKKRHPKSLESHDFKGIAASLYEEFVSARHGKGFETECLDPRVKAICADKVDIYREAMLLLSLSAEAQTQRQWKLVLHSCEECIFGTIPLDPKHQRLQAIKSAMADLSQLLNPDFKRELSWGLKWFQDIGDDATARNPVRLSLFVSAWMDEYIALVKTLRQVSDCLGLK
jgi:hypothetical protein